MADVLRRRQTTDSAKEEEPRRAVSCREAKCCAIEPVSIAGWLYVLESCLRRLGATIARSDIRRSRSSS